MVGYRKIKRKYLFVLIIVLILVIILLFRGCSSKKVDTSLKRGDIQVICNSGNLGDAVIITKSKIEANYDKNKKMINYKTIITENDVEKKTFLSRKENYDKTYNNIKSDENITYEYKVDNRKQTFTITTVYKNIDLNLLGEEEKARYELKDFIKFYEKSKYKCEIKGISRKEIGLK